MVFAEANALRTDPQKWLDRLVAFKESLPYALRYTNERNLDQAIWKIEDFINTCEKDKDGKCTNPSRWAPIAMKWNDGLALSAWESCRERVNDKQRRRDHGGAAVNLIKERVLQYGTAGTLIDEGLSFGGKLGMKD